MWFPVYIRTHRALSRCRANPSHDDIIKWKHFPRYWPFVRGIHRSPMNSPHKGQWRRALMFSLICAWINGWVSNREAGDLGHYRAHYDVTLMSKRFSTSRTPDHIHVCHIYAWLKWISIGPCNGLTPNRRQTHYLNHRWLIFDCKFKKNLQRYFEWIKKHASKCIYIYVGCIQVFVCEGHINGSSPGCINPIIMFSGVYLVTRIFYSLHTL